MGKGNGSNPPKRPNQMLFEDLREMLQEQLMPAIDELGLKPDSKLMLSLNRLAYGLKMTIDEYVISLRPGIENSARTRSSISPFLDSRRESGGNTLSLEASKTRTKSYLTARAREGETAQKRAPKSYHQMTKAEQQMVIYSIVNEGISILNIKIPVGTRSGYWRKASLAVTARLREGVTPAQLRIAVRYASKQSAGWSGNRNLAYIWGSGFPQMFAAATEAPSAERRSGARTFREADQDPSSPVKESPNDWVEKRVTKSAARLEEMVKSWEEED